jgi:hypothetical protein
MAVLWLLAGGAAGTLNGLSLRWTVARLHPTASIRAVASILVGAALRWLLSTSVLLGALHHDVTSALLAFTGLYLARWTTVVWYHRHPW